MNAMQISSAVQFLDDLLFWVQCPDDQTTKQDSWRNAMLERMEELLVDHVAYRSMSPKVRRLIHTLNGNPLPDFLRGSFLEVEKIRDDLRNELNLVDKQEGPKPAKPESIASDSDSKPKDQTPHPYKLYLAEFISQNPKVRNPKAAAAKAYWTTRLDKIERKDFADEESFVRSFKYFVNK